MGGALVGHTPPLTAPLMGLLMQLARFKMFLSELQTDTNLSRLTEDITVYRQWNGGWFDESDKRIEDSGLLHQLEETLGEGKHWRPTSSTLAYFPIPQFDAVALVQFQTITTYTTRNKVQSDLDRSVDRAQKAFDASHDLLTGLLNGHAINEKVQTAINSLAPLGEEDTHPETSPSTSASATLLALDIDHFKRVNDTYGHIYGDIVLTTLGRRFEAASQQLLEEKTGQIQDIYIARPSGEEFLVLVVGFLDIDATKQIADHFRHLVCNEPLPSDEEWEKVLSLEGPSEDIQPPPLAERQITISVGVASVGSPQALPKSDPVRAFRERADKALYCAKAGGQKYCTAL